MPVARAGVWLALFPLLSLVLQPALQVSAEPDCAAWPGEFSPLPRVDDPDPFAAEWARLRVRELSRTAQDLEGKDRVESHRLWQRVLCLDPDSAEARAGIERVRLRVVVPEGARVLPELAELDGSLQRVEELFFDARFQDAIRSVRELRRRLAALDTSPGVRDRRVRLEVLEATVWLAFGDQRAAQESFERALLVDPELELDSGTTPPKVRRVFEDARLALAEGEG